VECLATNLSPSGFFRFALPLRPRGFRFPLSVPTAAYQVIARKWRPQSFDDVVGQDHVVRTLRNAIARGRIAHAYLFVGPRGTGKTSTARIFAKALNCTGGPNADFDPADPACLAIAAGNHLDVIEIDGASNNGVDQVRDLRETVQYAPAQGKFKIYIIDEVHMLSAAAFNALLKTLEEPPSHVKFVFATTDPQKVLPTIISRCQRFDLKPIPAALIVERLQKIATAEGIQVSAAAFASMARMADGGMRDAQSIFDQLISFCGNTIAETDVLDVYGLVAAEQLAALAAALAAGDHAELIRLIDACDSAGRDLARLLADLQGHIRDALLDSITKRGRTAALGGVSLTTEQLTRMLDVLRQGEEGVKLGLSDKINLEVTLLKAVDASRARAIDSLLKELAILGAELPAPVDSEGGPAEQKKKL
jgi:DNA polymerase III subunit gamma/tau